MTREKSAARNNGGSVMTFVEEWGDREPCPRQHDDGGTLFARLPAQRQRGLSMPYSPGGKRGSLTTGALSPPVLTSGGARRQTSLKSDLRL